ncbi:MAG: tetratricopeptide repeat protein, partial [Candidatus Kapabacteria bacterium]|nr:tetratricopeptide repeat protein [Candidatus Kapabacteria bacterium]
MTAILQSIYRRILPAFAVNGTLRIVKSVSVLLAFTVPFLVSSCKLWDNSTTFFNTYYNAKKLMNESEEEFGYYDETLKPPKPRVVVPLEKDITLERKTGEPPKFANDMIIKQQKLQPVQVKVDSIIIKGSKILATHPKSDFIDGTLFLMAKAFFYRSEWLPSIIKCQELSEQFPESKFNPDAHLLQSKGYIVQQNYPKAKQMLSRTVDVAWQFRRYDILSEAFRLMAEVAIEEEDYDEAERPYRQAITQADDDRMRAKWQCDLGLILYRLGRFDKAAKELEKVEKADPDNLTLFEAKLYRAAALMRSEHYTESVAIMDEIDESRKFDDYRKAGYLNAHRLTWLRLAGKTDSLARFERHVDSTAVGSQPVITANFETGMDYFRKKDYSNARSYFARSKTVRSPVFDGANLLFNLLNSREDKMYGIDKLSKQLAGTDTLMNRDSAKAQYAKLCFELGRIHEQIFNPDSATVWYSMAVDYAPAKDTMKAQYLYSLARMKDNTDKEYADSLHEIIFKDYKATTFGLEAKQRLGYTDYAILDSAAEFIRSGAQFRAIGDYATSIRQYSRVYTDFPYSQHAAKALYSIGWIWERKLMNNDSAFYYYKLLVKKYQESEYAKDILYSVAYFSAKQHGDSS